MFAVTAAIMGALKTAFVLTNENVAWVMSGGTWGFTLSIIALGPLCDALGMKRLIWLALACHTVGIGMMIFATGFWMLFFGTLVNSIGSGAIEAACNPLTATIYPDKKTHKLNQFHMWFPGGIVLGGLACYLLDQIAGSRGSAGLEINSILQRSGVAWWQVKLAIVLLPTAAYGIMFMGQTFPATERVQAGISFGGMVKETFLRPLFLVLLVCMTMTASLELGPQRWIPSVLEAGGIPGILVLVWITGLMAILRLFAGPVVRLFTNTGLLLASAAVSGVGLLMLSYGGSIYLVAVTATVFAFGVCYFWPTMVGTVAERVPKGGALALAIIGGTGSLMVGVVTTPFMGWVADGYLHQELVFKGAVDGQTVDRQKETLDVLKDIHVSYRNWARTLEGNPQADVARREAWEAIAEVQGVLDAWDATGTLPEGKTAGALRMAIKNGPAGGVEPSRSEPETKAMTAKAEAEAILKPADNKGGLISFRYVAPLSLVLVIIFGVMFIQDRRRGGYKAERIEGQRPSE
jgi:hypothetical protein